MKPIAFNEIKAQEQIQQQTDEINKLKEINNDLLIRCRIAETELSTLKANIQSNKSLEAVIDTQQKTIETYHKIIAYQKNEIDRLKGGGVS